MSEMQWTTTWGWESDADRRLRESRLQYEASGPEPEPSIYEEDR